VSSERSFRDRADAEIDLLRKIVAIPSPSGEEDDLAAWLVGRMAALGFRVRRDAAGNVVGEIGEGPRVLLLLGHMDTVAGFIPLREEGRVLYGRGVVDAKGSLAAFISAATRTRALPGWRVVLAAAIEEETSGSRGARHLLSHLPRPDWCVVGEPSGWDRITIGYRGCLVSRIRLRLPLAHSAGPCSLPAESAVSLWNEMVARCRRAIDGGGRFDQIDPSLRQIATRDDGLYGLVDMTVGFRLPPTHDPEFVEQMLNDLLDALGESAPHPSGRIEIETSLEILGKEVAYQSDKNTELTRAFLKAIRTVGGRPRFVRKTGTSDMNVVGPVWRCPIVAYGPGDASLDHTPHEHIDLDEYLRAIDVLEHMLRRASDGRGS